MPAPKRQPPSQNYNGLTIILSNPSRFDTEGLITATAGTRFNNEGLQPLGTNRWQCDIRTVDCTDQLLPGTKAALLLGEAAYSRWCPKYSRDYTINEQRGYPLETIVDGVVGITSYLPQEALDYKDYESKYNPLLLGRDSLDEDEDDEDDDDIKRHGRTSPTNQFHWLLRDAGKAYYLTQRPLNISKYDTIIAPPTADIVRVLTSTRDDDLYLDIETDLVARNLLCIGFSFGGSSSGNPVYVVPFIRWNYQVAYSEYANILRAFSVALRHNRVVCHNAMFDLFVLAHRYSLGFGRRVYCTMLAQHRCFPEAEKSLGHSMSCWPQIHEPFHKDEGVFPPHNPDQERQLWNYNAKDVWAMKLIKEAQEDYARHDTGLQASIAQANSMIRPYIISQLLGFRYNHTKRESMLKENDRLMTHYLRAMRILVGREVLPTSWQQVGKYLYDECCYTAPHKTKTGNRSTDDKAIQKLKLKHSDNPVLDFILAFRERSKESGQLKFIPWKQPPASQQTLMLT